MAKKGRRAATARRRAKMPINPVFRPKAGGPGLAARRQRNRRMPDRLQCRGGQRAAVAAPGREPADGHLGIGVRCGLSAGAGFSASLALMNS